MMSGSDLRMTVRQLLSAFRIRFDPEENKNLTEERGFFMKNLIVGQSGGPTAVINSSLYGVIQEGLAHSEEIGHVYGMINGIQGFLKGKYMDLAELDSQTLTALRTTPGAYLGSCRYKLPENLSDPVYAELFWKFEELSIGYFLYIGGNDSMDTVDKLSRYAEKIGSDVKFIGIPKTIDNDLWGTDMTFGFQSAVDIATDTIDRIHTTATSHSRVFIIEVMGHKVGHVTLHAGIAGGADIILLPELPYDIKAIKNVIDKRTQAGKRFTILAVAEGAISKEDAKLKKKEYKEKLANRKYPSIAYELAEQIEKETDKEVRITVPGHTQRGGTPCAYDRVFATRVGAKAAELILNEEYGYMVAMRNGETVKVPLEEVAGKLKYVDPNCGLIKEARTIGISFGDEV